MFDLDSHECPECAVDLEHDDTFGNSDYCLNAIGHPRGAWDPPRRPVKTGDIYKCPECGESFYTLDAEDANTLHRGYPC